MLTAEQLKPMRCPCGESALARNGTEDGGVVCGACGNEFMSQDGITDFVQQDTAVGKGSKGDAAQTHYWEEEEEIYRRYDHPVALGFAQQRAAYIRRTVPLENVSTAIDVGAGNGMSTHVLEEDIETIYSVDMSRHLLLENPATTRIRTDAYRLPFGDKSVDLAYSWELLHHVAGPRTVLAEMSRVARQYVFFFEPNQYNPAIIIGAALSKPN